MMKYPDILSAILAINPDAAAGVRGNSYDKITWYKNKSYPDGTPVISKEDIQAKQAELQAAYDAKQYQRDRISLRGNNVYPPIEDQLDMIYHDQVNGTTTFKDAIKVVKDAHPKGGS